MLGFPANLPLTSHLRVTLVPETPHNIVNFSFSTTFMLLGNFT